MPPGGSVLASLLIKLGVDASEVDTQFGKVRRAAQNLGVAISAGAALKKFVDETVAAQNAHAQLAAALVSTGGVAGRSMKQLNDMAASLQRTSTYSDEAVKGAQALLLTFKKVRGDQFDDATRAVVDLATRMGGDLKGAALQVGKALEDPVNGLVALRRSGVSFSDAQRDVIKNLVETGRLAEAQTIILQEMSTQFGGSAAAARNTLGGALTYLSNQWGELFEASAEGSSGIVGAINAIADALPKVRTAVDFVIRGWQAMGVQSAVVVEQLKLVARALDPRRLWSAEARAAFDEQKMAVDRMKEAAASMLDTLMNAAPDASAEVVTLTQNLTAQADALADGADAAKDYAAELARLNGLARAASAGGVPTLRNPGTPDVGLGSGIKLPAMEQMERSAARIFDASGKFDRAATSFGEGVKQGLRDSLKGKLDFRAIGSGLATSGIEFVAGKVFDFVGGLFSAGQAAKEAAKAAREAARIEAEAAAERAQVWLDQSARFAQELEEEFMQLTGKTFLGGAADAWRTFIANEELLAKAREYGMEDVARMVIAERELAAARKKAEASLRFMEDLAVEGFRAVGQNGTADRASLLFTQRRRRDEEVAAGRSAEEIALLDLVHGLQQQALALDQWVTSQTDAIERFAEAQIDGLQEQEQTAQEQLRVQQDQLRAQEQTVQALRQAVSSLAAFSRDLSIGSLSPLSASDQLEQARGQFEALRELAMAGDVSAAGDLPASARAFLEMSREMNASSLAFVEDFNRVKATVDAVREKFAGQLTIEEQALAELQEQGRKLSHQIQELQRQQQEIRAAADAQVRAVQAEAQRQREEMAKQLQAALDQIQILKDQLAALKQIKLNDADVFGDDQIVRKPKEWPTASAQSGTPAAAVDDTTSHLLLAQVVERLDRLERAVQSATSDVRLGLEAAAL